VVSPAQGSGLTLSALTALLASLPTSLPAVAGQLWMDGQVLAIS